MSAAAIARASLLPAVVLFVLLLPTVHVTEAAADRSDLQIHVLDVGQGDALILYQPGRCTAVIDTGGLLYGHRVTQRLEQLDVTTIDLLIITHPHLDHFGGLFDIAPRFTIRRFYDNGGHNPVREYFSEYLTVREQLSAATLQQGDQARCGDIEITVLHPKKPPQPDDDINDGSLALLASFGSFRLLHMGDLTTRAEAELLAQDIDLRAHLLKVGHHGAADATSQDLLERVAPDNAIISCGPGNWIGAPAEATLTRLDDAGIDMFRTDRDGTVVFNVSSSGVTTTETQRGSPILQ